MECVFWDNVKVELKRQGKSQQDLANYFDSSIRTVQNWFYRGNPPELNIAIGISNFLNVNLYTLSGIDKKLKKIEVTEEQLTFLELFNKLQDPCKQTVLTMMKQLSGVNIITPEN